MAVKLMNFKQLQEDFELYCTETGKTEADDKATVVQQYIAYKKFDETHAAEILAILNGDNPTVKDIEIRKTHLKRDKWIKKRLIPILVSIGVGFLTGWIATLATTLATGSSFLWLTMIGKQATDLWNIRTTFTVLGTIGCAGFIKLKNVLTLKYYESKYGSAKKCLTELENGVELENLKICQLMNLIETAKQDILSNGKHINHKNNAINRNRIHHIEAVSIDLVNQLNEIMASSLSDEDKKIQSANIITLLERISKFITNDVETSKVYALTNCNETGEHTHKIENLDIYANLQTVLSVYKNLEDPKKRNDKTTKADIKQKLANMDIKIAAANSIFNPNDTTSSKSLILETLERLKPDTAVEEVSASRPVIVPKKKFIDSISKHMGWTIIKAGNKKFMYCETIDSEKIDAESYIDPKGKKSVLHLADGSEIQVQPYDETIFTDISLTTEIRSKGKIVGQQLTLYPKNDKIKTVIRFIYAKKKIVKTITLSGGETYTEEITPSTSLPLEEISQMIREEMSAHSTGRTEIIET